MAGKRASGVENEIYKFIGLFPHEVAVEVLKNDGGFIAEVKTYPGLATEASSFSELIEMVNDAIRTYLEIPEKYLPFMPSYTPPVSQAKNLDVFPRKKGISLNLELRDGQRVKG